MCSSGCFSSMFLLPMFFLWMWIAFILTNPSALFWILALLLVEKSIVLDYTTMYLSLYTTYSWFCSFHSASVPGGHSISHGISPVHYSFEHSSIPSPTYIPQFVQPLPIEGHSFIFQFFATTENVAINNFVQVVFPMISLGYKPSSGMAGSKGRQSLIALWA